MAAFLVRLREDHERHGVEWENQTLDGFLEALGAWIADAQGRTPTLSRSCLQMATGRSSPGR
ncbi:DUF7660 family protein [Streptomyces niveus]|uniref:DUF7660 family protein n=1 Tax=Streptomyces niveus TaxID=193462 RepID=UPI003F4DB447